MPHGKYWVQKFWRVLFFFTLSVSSVKKTVNGHVFNSSMWIHTDDKQIYICFQLQKNHVNRSRRLFVSVHTYTQYARYALPKHNNYRLMRHRFLKIQTICIYYSVLYLQLVIHFMFMLQNGLNCWFKFGLYAVFLFSLLLETKHHLTRALPFFGIFLLFFYEKPETQFKLCAW